jgi:hypothetical protein
VIPHEKLINALRSKKFEFKRQSDRVDIYKQKGTAQRVFIKRNAMHSEDYATVLLRQMGFTPSEIDKFVAETTDGKHRVKS